MRTMSSGGNNAEEQDAADQQLPVGHSRGNAHAYTVATRTVFVRVPGFQSGEP